MKSIFAILFLLSSSWSIQAVTPLVKNKEDDVVNNNNRRRELQQQLPRYRRPDWWRFYRNQFGIELQRCRRITRRGTFPRTGQRCPRRRNIIRRSLPSFFCLFGTNDSCSNGSPQPQLECTCPQDVPARDRVWSCERFVPDCPPLSDCPADRPSTGSSCAGLEDGRRCTYGTDTCCGQEFPSFTCTCRDGQFGCFFNDSCLTSRLPGGCDFEPVELTCPEEYPGPSWACRDGANSPVCTYDATQECCGVTRTIPNGRSIQCVDGRPNVSLSLPSPCPTCTENDRRCPARLPESIGSATCDIEGLNCIWGRIDCGCNGVSNFIDEYRCQCAGGVWRCALPACQACPVVIAASPPP